jgi:hypothetical protein
VILYLKMYKLLKAKYKFVGRARWNDPGLVFSPHQLAFDKAEGHVGED